MATEKLVIRAGISDDCPSGVPSIINKQEGDEVYYGACWLQQAPSVCQQLHDQI